MGDCHSSIINCDTKVVNRLSITSHDHKISKCVQVPTDLHEIATKLVHHNNWDALAFCPCLAWKISSIFYFLVKDKKFTVMLFQPFPLLFLIGKINFYSIVKYQAGIITQKFCRIYRTSQLKEYMDSNWYSSPSTEFFLTQKYRFCKHLNFTKGNDRKLFLKHLWFLFMLSRKYTKGHFSIISSASLCTVSASWYR